MRLTIFSWLQNLFIPVPAQFPGEHTTLLSLQHWELLKNTSNHCPTRHTFTHGSRECIYRLSTLPNDTLPHPSCRGPYPRPLHPKSGAMATDREALLVYSVCSSGIETLRVVTPRESVLSLFSFVPPTPLHSLLK